MPDVRRERLRPRALDLDRGTVAEKNCASSGAPARHAAAHEVPSGKRSERRALGVRSSRRRPTVARPVASPLTICRPVDEEEAAVLAHARAVRARTASRATTRRPLTGVSSSAATLRAQDPLTVMRRSSALGAPAPVTPTGDDDLAGLADRGRVRERDRQEPGELHAAADGVDRVDGSRASAASRFGPPITIELAAERRGGLAVARDGKGAQCSSPSWWRGRSGRRSCWRSRCARRRRCTPGRRSPPRSRSAAPPAGSRHDLRRAPAG